MTWTHWLQMLDDLCTAIFVSASHQTGLDTRSMTRRSIIVGIEGRRDRARADWNPAGLCWSSALLVQCGPGEPSRTWTQT